MKIFTTTVVQAIKQCIGHPWIVVIIAILLSAASVGYSVRHFALNADINKLLSPDLPWRKREIAFNQLFPQFDLILAVVQAPTPELTNQATAELVGSLAKRRELFRSVTTPGDGEFFARNGLLFQPTEQLKQTLDGLVAAEPLIEVLASDPSLRGIAQTLSFGVMGTERGRITLDAMTRPMTMGAETLERVLANEQTSFSWLTLVSGHAPKIDDLRQVILIRPVLDFAALEPGKLATDTIRAAAADLKLAERYQASVRLTGPVPMADEEFGTIKENALLNGSITILVVLFILWRALGSGRVILAVFLNLVVGLAITAAMGLLMVGALNLISVYFAVLFVGLGVDFGIQFSVRYRSVRHTTDDLHEALLQTGRRAGAPLTLAALATAAGFLSFLPTVYKGVSELGLIAGIGMLIAFASSATLLPALLNVLKPPGEAEQLGYAALAPVDRFLERHRMAILIVTAVVVTAGLPLLYWLRFDFNPINLRSPNTEAVSTYLSLKNDPDSGFNDIQVLAPSLEGADRLAEKLRTLPEVARVTTLSNFIPADQQQKLPLIQNAAKVLLPLLNPTAPSPPPTDAQNVSMMGSTVDALKRLAGNGNGAGAVAARRLADAMTALSKADPAARERVQDIIVQPLRIALDDLRNLLTAHEVTRANLPPELVRGWLTSDGRARIDLAPSGESNNNEVLQNFARAVQAVAPEATEGPISILEARREVVIAFLEAGGCALLSIGILLWITLRRFGDVLLTLVPLLLAGVVTLEICVLIDLPLNFANIIALPLLLGVGVAFKIYYIMAWRAGQTNLLQSVLTRAVTFSACTTATAFGSLWFSSHPGTSSMGKLLAISLLTTMAAAALFQPVLMGKPREIEPSD